MPNHVDVPDDYDDSAWDTWDEAGYELPDDYDDYAWDTRDDEEYEPEAAFEL